MTIMTYLIVGVVVWTICIGECWIRNGWDSVESSHTHWWSWYTDAISTALLWPAVVLCYAVGAIIELLMTLKAEGS